MAPSTDTDDQALSAQATRPPREMRLVVCTDSPSQRARIESFIAARFAEQYGARLRNFMPELLALEDSSGALRAAVGLRRAGRDHLFLERYLDQPIERAIALSAGDAPLRARIAEAGNLAALGARRPLMAAMMISAAIKVLALAGTDWLTFTGTSGLIASLPRLGLAPEAMPPLCLGPADPTRLGDEQADWGSYYDSRPRVMASMLVREPCRRGEPAFADARTSQSIRGLALHA